MLNHVVENRVLKEIVNRLVENFVPGPLLPREQAGKKAARRPLFLGA
jgi:hypothetical protein